VLDDTYNANPAGATAALATLRRLGTDATRRVVVTPGMVELGPRQAEENGGFAARVAEVATDLVVVGRTNRRALLRGVPPPSSSGGAPRIVVVRTRPEATAWVRDHLEHGDVVLYENDLPDHYP
jgi:UDP-N-acetylmuramoyl-tripeptide--D-alanyl-D-alanine ligase